MPINLPNGNEVDKIVLPNGANASQVIGPNGQVVWEGSAIRDSVVAQYDATEESSTGAISSIADQAGSFDLSGSCTVVSDGINGLQSYDFDGTEEMTNSSISIGTPAVTAIVAQWDVPPDTGNALYDSRDSNNRRQFDADNGWRIFHGDNTQEGGTEDQNPHLFIHTGNAAGSADDLEVDGTEQINADAGDGSIESFGLADDAEGGSTADVTVGEVVHYDDPTDSELDSERDRLADKWGITI